MLLLKDVLLGSHTVLNELHLVHFGILRRLDIRHDMLSLREAHIPHMLLLIILERCHLNEFL